jgi:carboxyl-terminal processing protease
VADNQHTMAAVSKHKRPVGITKNIYFLTIAVTAVIGFVAGTRSGDIISAIAPVFGFKVVTGTLDLSAVQRTYQQLASNYDGKLDTQALIDGASKGLVAAAGDKFTMFMDAKEASAFDNDLSGNIGGGIGAEIGLRNDKPTIIRILPGNPAEKAGLAAGDVILSVNDQSTSGWSADQTATAVRGDVGTTVKMTVMRGTAEKDFTVTRATVDNPSVDSRVTNGIGILTISRFDDQTGLLAQKAAENFKQQNVKGVILDLRDNGGGYITAAQDVAGLWVKDKLIVSERTNGQTTDQLTSGDNPVLAGIPTVVLVNGSTASASEIVSGALKDYKAATLIGEKTYGKGTVQKVLDLGAGTKLKVTVARWYTPNGQNIDKQGITPDQTVKLTADDMNAGNDPQMTAALSHLGQ